MTVLLVSPPGLRMAGGRSYIDGLKRNLGPSQCRSMPMEHLGMMSIKAYAVTQGVEITCINALIAGHTSVEQTWLAIVGAAHAQSTPRLIGFSCIDTLPEVLWLAQRARQTWDGVRIAIGNTLATLNCERILSQHDCIDFVVVGDGEVAFTRLAEAVLNDTSSDDVPGLARRDATGQVVYSPPVLVDLDELPPPARDELPIVLAQGFAGSVFTTRGCLYRCTFCGTGATSGLLGSLSYRAKSVDAVVDEIAYLVSDFGLDHFTIADDLFVSKHPSSQQRAADFAHAVLSRGLDVTFMIDARLDSVTDLDLFKHLHKAGLRRVFIGLETGSYNQLRAYSKPLFKRGDDAAARVQALQQLGIDVIPGIIMFHPTVQPAELRETARLLRVTNYQIPTEFIDRVTAYPGTPLHREYIASGYLTAEWPLGVWEFADSEAARVYADIVDYITADSEITFAQAEAFFLSRLNDWEKVIADRAGTTASRPVFDQTD